MKLYKIVMKVNYNLTRCMKASHLQIKIKLKEYRKNKF